jgi:hypothetical protein
MASLTSPSGLVLSSSGRRAFQQTRVAQMLSTAPFGASNPSASAAHPMSSLSRTFPWSTRTIMLTDQRPVRCGGCGGEIFKVYTADKTLRIVVECQGCKSTSYIEPEPAKLQIELGEGDGRITLF